VLLTVSANIEISVDGDVVQNTSAAVEPGGLTSGSLTINDVSAGSTQVCVEVV